MGVANYLVAKWGDPPGDTFATPMSNEEILELAQVIREAAPEEYQGYRVKTPEKVWRTRNKKTSPGFLFEGSVLYMTEEEDVPTVKSTVS